MVNPFIDDQAYESDDDVYDDADTGNTAGGEEGTGWNDEDDPEVHNEDRLVDFGLSVPDSLPPRPRPRLEAVTDRLLARYVQTEVGHSSSQVPVREDGDEFDDTTLKKILCADGKQVFWRIKCKPGSEMELVFDIMHYRQILTTPSQSPEPSSMPVGVRTKGLSSAARALKTIRQYALTQDGEPKTVADELEKVLGSEWSVEWTRLIDAAGLEPGEGDVQAALNNVNQKAAAFLPVLVLQEASLSFSDTPPIPSASLPPQSTNHHPGNHSPTVEATTILSAFCVPTVSGFVYLEGHCNAVWLDWFMQRSTVFKKTHSKIWIEPVECEEIGVLLDTPISSIHPMSWVRVKYGLYRHDVGLVLSREMRGGQRRFKVLLVPRLPGGTSESERPPTPPPKPTHPLVLSDATPMSSKPPTEQSRGKRQRSLERPPQMLFQPQTFAGELTKISEDIYESPYAEFRYDLAVKYYDSSSLTQQDVTMDTRSRRLFEMSRDPVLRKVRLPVPDDWIFFAEEEVVAVVGAPLVDRQRVNPDLPQATYRKNAVIVDAGERSCTVQFYDYSEFDSDETKTSISTVNLRKRIGIGHSVEVVAGEHKGRQGLVLSNSFDTLEVMESIAGKNFDVHVNCCRITARRNSSVVPWLGQHVVVIYGQYRGYSGIVVDVHPPRPHYTMVDISFANLGVTVPVQHDFVVDSISTNHWLRIVSPLTAQQQNFRQPSWDVYYAPNLQSPPIDRYTGRYITAADLVNRQPPEPWVNIEVMVIRGSVKGKATVKHVERSYQYPSGLRVEVEYDYISAEHGANPHYWCDYADVRDPRTGLPLHIVYPLKREQRYWEPLARIKAVSVRNPYATQPWQRPVSKPATPLWSPDVADIFLTPAAGPSNTCHVLPPSHWALDPRLDQKPFFVCWKPRSGMGHAKVTAIPQCQFGKIQLKDGASGWFVPPEEVHDLATSIKPTTVKDSLLVVRGPYTGTNMRPVFSKYIQGRREALIIGAVYENWATGAEKYTGRDIEVEPENCALAGLDPNKAKFKDEIKGLRDRYRQPAEGKKTRKRAIKPRGG
ncbi:hypothetical protein VKT23_013809 [Stygiomarasmius scandens]|uniref:KOW domain-containing protein n=1 Tax=Marasmiellus scandens TaxID=2682957 RepID=A0ABR1J588_9AGAR